MRELQYVVERAVILSQDGPLRFFIEWSVPVRSDKARPISAVPTSPQLLTREDLRRLEHDSIVIALKQAGGKIFGPNGAAQLLGMKPTTLTSRIVALVSRS